LGVMGRRPVTGRPVSGERKNLPKVPAESGGSKSWRKVGADHTISAEWAGLTMVIACWIGDVAMIVSALQHAVRVALL
ncbi:hypothetical protein, partial [Pseudomonas viridiflava]|uniref:hypothetical protein n=1 Tax=Pseudomonas viridiflava TaxID=33069 RepID=UPI00197DCEBD